MEFSANHLTELSQQAISKNILNIFNFLDLKSLLNSLQVSKTFFKIVNQFFQHYLTHTGIVTQISDQIPLEHYYKVYRYCFKRDIIIAPINSGSQPLPITDSTLAIDSIHSRYAKLGAKYFSMGTKMTAFHLNNNDMVFIKTDEYLKPGFNVEALARKNYRKNVRKFFTKSNDLVYITENGQLHIIFYNAAITTTELSEAVWEYSVTNPIKNCEASYTYALMTFETTEGEGQPKDSGVKLLSFHEATAETINNGARIGFVEGIHQSKIADMGLGGQIAYFADENGLTWEVDMSIPRLDNFFKVSVVESLKTKRIKKLYCGLNFYFALERDLIDSIDKWNNKQILEWAEKINFTDYLKILQYENITGKDLINADKKFLEDRLGLKKEDLQTKFFTEITTLAKPSFGKQRLYGWGNNTWGQLGVQTPGTNVIHAIEIPMPNLEKENDEILKIECGWKQSVIFTKNNNLWISEPIIKDPNAKKEKEEAEAAGKGKGKKDNYDGGEPKKQKKNSYQGEEKPHKAQKGDKGVEEAPHHRWLDVSKSFKSQKEKKEYMIIGVSLNKDHMIILGAYLGKKTEKNKAFMLAMNQFRLGPQRKLKGADEIINRIKWDKSQDKDDFVIGYEDRFLGIMEITFAQFEKADIPMHRIKHFKKKGEVVWDRTNKTYTL
jgi:uncharacterized protein (UPF0248 family)